MGTWGRLDILNMGRQGFVVSRLHGIMIEKITKCAPNATNGAHLCAKVWDLCAKVWFIYYINVRQIVGCKKSAPLCHKCGKNLFWRVIPPTVTLRWERENILKNSRRFWNILRKNIADIYDGLIWVDLYNKIGGIKTINPVGWLMGWYIYMQMEKWSSQTLLF